MILTEVAGEGGTNWAPQKFLSSQQFRHLIRCTKHVNKNPNNNDNTIKQPWTCEANAS